MESKTSVENFKTYPTVGRLTQADLQRYRLSHKRKAEKAASKAESVKTEKAAQKVEPVKIENVTQRDKAVKTDNADLKDKIFKTEKVSPKGQNLSASLTVTFEEAALGCDKVKLLLCSDGGLKNLQIHVPAGIDEGMRLRLHGQGQPSVNGGEAGDLYITIHIDPSDVFERKDFDVYTKVRIPFATAKKGGKVNARTIDGKVLECSVPAGTTSNQMLCLKGQGIVSLKDPKVRGDLYAIIQVDEPEQKTTSDQNAARTSSSKRVKNSQNEKKTAGTTSQSAKSGQNVKNNASTQSGSTANTKVNGWFRCHVIDHVIVLWLSIFTIAYSLSAIYNDFTSGKINSIGEAIGDILLPIVLCMFPIVVYGFKKEKLATVLAFCWAIGDMVACMALGAPWFAYLDTHDAPAILVFILLCLVVVRSGFSAKLVVESLQRKASEKGKK